MCTFSLINPSFISLISTTSAKPGGEVVKHPMQEMPETQVQSLGPEDPLEKEMATRSIILAWRIPRTEEPGGLQKSPWGHKESIEQLSVRTHTHTYTHTHTHTHTQPLNTGGQRKSVSFPGTHRNVFLAPGWHTLNAC